MPGVSEPNTGEAAGDHTRPTHHNHTAGTATPRTGAAGGRAIRAVIWLPGLAVAVGAAVATAHGLFEVALAARVPAGIAWLYPLITDGLALVAYAATARLCGGPARYAWSVVVLAAGLSGLAQASYLAGGATLDASPALRFGVGAWPAVAAAVVAHLLYLLAAHPATLPSHLSHRTGLVGRAEDGPITPADELAPGTDSDVPAPLHASTQAPDDAVQTRCSTPAVHPARRTTRPVQSDPRRTRRAADGHGRLPSGAGRGRPG